MNAIVTRRAPGRIAHENHPLFRAAFAAFVKEADTSGRQSGRSAEDIARGLWPEDDLTQRVITRADASPLSTSGQPALLGTSVGEFFASLPLSAGARLIGAGLHLPLADGKPVTVPGRTGGPALVPWVGELDAIPIRDVQLAGVTIGPAKKMAVASVASAELVKRGSAEAVLRQIMMEDAAASLDAALFNDAAATDDNPAGLLNGVTPIPATSGGDMEAAMADLQALANALATAGATSFVIIANPKQAYRLQLMLPHLTWPVWPTLQVPDDQIIGIDPSAFAWGAGDRVDIDVTRQAAAHMSDTPLEIVSAAGTTADPVRSFWQTDSIGIRMLAWMSFSMRAEGRVQVVDGVTW